jgi:flagellar basal body-associated protein FliL
VKEKSNMEKNKVGRPKLADSKTKKESIFVCLFVLVVIVVVAIIGYNILTIDFNPKYTVGTIYNNHVNSCVIESNKIDCGPNVTYMKYKLDDDKYVEITKQDKSIEVKLDKYSKISVCYKTDTTDLTCK